MIEAYWESFLSLEDNRRQYTGRHYTAWHFCDNKDDADKLAALVLDGTKRGTAGLKASFEVEGESLPKPGDLSIILNWEGVPQCIIETVNVWTWPFGEVPAWFAEIEGEGDGSLEYWKRVHREYFTRESAELGIEFGDDSPVVCEEFRVIFSRSTGPS